MSITELSAHSPFGLAHRLSASREWPSPRPLGPYQVTADANLLAWPHFTRVPWTSEFWAQSRLFAHLVGSYPVNRMVPFDGNSPYA